MHAESTKRHSRILTVFILVLALTGCGEGDGQTKISGTAATPLPPLPAGFCDPINFEILCPPPTIVNFNGGATTIIDNPDLGALNDSESVAQMQKFPDDPALLFGGTKFELAEAIDFSAGEAYTIKIWSPRVVAVSFKLEETNNPGGGDTDTVNHSGSGMWEELCFDFTGQSVPGDVLALTIIFDNGVAGAADTNPNDWTFYYDDITQVASCGNVGGNTMLPVDFENDPASYDFGNGGGFEGGIASVIANPEAIAINVSAQVGQMQKFRATSGAVFGGSTLQLDTPADVVADSSFTMKVWSQRQVVVLLQPEPQGPGTGTEVIHTGTGWEELPFSLPALSGTVNGITLIFDNGTLGDAADNPTDWTFYFDDIALVPPGGGGGGTAPTVAATTPTEAATDVVSLFSGAYTDVAVGDFSTTWDTADVSDVQVAGDDVKLYVPTGGGATLGFIGINFDNANAVDGTAYDTLRMDVWTPDVTNLLVKLVDFGGDGFGGTLADTTGTSTQTLTPGSWQTISIPFSEFMTNGLMGITELSQIVLEDLDGASGGTALYVDNLYFFNSAGGGGGGGELAVNGDVETGDLTGWTDFPNAGTVSVSNPGAGGSTFAVNLNASGVATAATIKQANLGAGTLTPGQQVTVTFDWKGTDGIGGVVDAKLFSEVSPSGVSQTDQILSGASFPFDWTTVGPLDITIGPDVSGGVTLEISAICGADAGCVSSIFIDNVSITTP